MKKRWFKRLAAKVAKSVIEHFEPKVGTMKNKQLKLVLQFSLKWVKKVLEVLTDVNPNDEQQLEAVAQELIDKGPKEGLEVAKAILLVSVEDEEAKALLVSILDDLIEEKAKTA